MSENELLWVALGVIAGSLLGVYYAKRKLVIKYSVKHIFLLIPVLCLFVSYTAVYALESVICGIITKHIPTEDLLCVMLHSIFENGLFIPILSYGLSWLFFKCVVSYDLCGLEKYSHFVFKICFSFMTVLIDVLVLYVVQSDTTYYSEEAKYFINRLSMWVITSIGLWIGIFTHKNKVLNESQNNKEDVENQRNSLMLSEGIKYVLSIICSLAVCAFIEWTVINKTLDGIYNRYISLLALFFGLSIVISTTISNEIYKPSKKRSLRIFDKLTANYRGGVTKKKHFGRMEYFISNGILKIEKTDISYPGHETDDIFKELFREIKYYPIKDVGFEYIKSKMIMKYDAQKKYISDSFDRCRVEYQNSKG